MAVLRLNKETRSRELVDALKIAEVYSATFAHDAIIGAIPTDADGLSYKGDLEKLLAACFTVVPTEDMGIGKALCEIDDDYGIATGTHFVFIEDNFHALFEVV